MGTQTPVTAAGTPMFPGMPLREFDTLDTEHDYVLTHEFGLPPEDLRGTLYRNGMGRWESGGSPVGHIFDGDGMVSSFAFDGQRVRFRNRYVRTRHFRHGQGAGGPAGRSTGTLRGDGGIRANALRWPLSNQANTNVVWHAGELLALWEAGKPHAIDPDTLATKGVHDFAGRLRGFGSFSAHPKIDARTGELFNFGTDYLPFPGITAYRVDTAGNLHTLARWRTPVPRLNHDMGLTGRYLVFVLSPMVVSAAGMLPVFLGRRPLSSALSFRPAIGTEIVLVPRDGGRPVRVHTEALLQFHIANCYDDGTDTVIELVRYTAKFDDLWDHFHRGFRTAPERPVVGGPLTRLRVTRTGRVLREDLSDRITEFPQIDSRRTGRRHRYSYSVDVAHHRADPAAGGQEVAPSGITVLDHERGTESTYAIANYGSACEAVFAPRSPQAPEGDGWLLTVEYLRDEHRSRLLVLDARHPERGPVYAGGLRHHLPMGLHGSFTTRSAS